MTICFIEASSFSDKNGINGKFGVAMIMRRQPFRGCACGYAKIGGREVGTPKSRAG